METVYVLVKTQPGLVEPIMHEVASNAAVTEAVAVTGSYDIIAKVEKEFVTEALSIVVKEIRQIEGVVSTETLVALKM
jgi:DNA-binding Lrp family transcriptional regulator